ncbi:uncharacterized protein V1513DRAFT_375935 [Lipomyces chichibuensis]|uniref:uncharacterized protein n=1 Tax=Lipomyces chichibuensis TaxID=1546026 RepID=UPI003343DE73
MPFGQASVPFTPPETNLKGKTVIVTGANTGLGLNASRQFLIFGASRVILAVRNVSKGEAARQVLLNDLTVKNNNIDAEVKVMQLDLSDYKSVVKFTTDVKKELDDLHILLLNAGLNLMDWEETVDGHEMTFQVNYLSNALLALELLPLLEQTAIDVKAPTRISWVGSQTQAFNSFSKKPLRSDESFLHRFDDKTQYSSFFRYSDSKFLVSMFVQELAKHVPQDKVVINHVCPGMVSTGIDANLPFYLRPIVGAVKSLFARTAEEGARILIYAAAVAGPDTHGAFIVDNKIVPIAPITQTENGKEMQKKLWDETLVELTKMDKAVADVLAAQ